jgi:hypothetical protein
VPVPCRAWKNNGRASAFALARPILLLRGISLPERTLPGQTLRVP